MNKLILVEGIPGSGKTTISKKIASHLSAKVRTNLYNEGQMHPADLAWCAYIPVHKYEELLKKYPHYEEAIQKITVIEAGSAIVPYTQIKIEDKELRQYLESFEIYDGKAGLDNFSRLHFARWERFSAQAEQKNEVNIFECAFLQNHICELMLFYNLGERQITEHLLTLIDTVSKLNPVLIYLSQANVEETIRRVSEQRINSKGEKAWMERVVHFIANSPYGMKHQLSGFDGMMEFFRARKEIELAVIEKLPIEAHIIHNPNYNWDEVCMEIDKMLDGLEVK